MPLRGSNRGVGHIDAQGIKIPHLAQTVGHFDESRTGSVAPYVAIAELDRNHACELMAHALGCAVNDLPSMGMAATANME